MKNNRRKSMWGKKVCYSVDSFMLNLRINLWTTPGQNGHKIDRGR